MALTHKLDLRPNLVSFWGKETVKAKKKRREEEEEEGGAKKGMETNLEYEFLEFGMKLHGF